MKDNVRPGPTGNKVKEPKHLLLKEQAAKVLVSATREFLRRNNISEETIRAQKSGNLQTNLRVYRKLMRAYEYMGVLMGTWFSNPQFLDKFGNPVALSPRSIPTLIRASRVPLTKSMALEFLRCSPSINATREGKFIALRRVFVLPEFEVPRAALVVERYLDTLYRNKSLRKFNATLLERSCHATGVDLTSSAPILRDIKERGAAFMDSVDGEIESRRARRTNKRRDEIGELGVLVFAWTRPNLLGRSNKKL